MTTCLGLNGTISLAAPLGVDVTSLEPKMPFRRYTANPAIATTSTATRSIHRRNNRLPSENRCIRDPFDERRHVDGRWGRFLQFGGDINLVDSTVRDRTAQVLLR